MQAISHNCPPTKLINHWKIQYGRQVAILKVTLLKINMLLPIHASDVPLKFELDIQNQTKVRVQKPKIQYSLQVAHFESDIIENQ